MKKKIEPKKKKATTSLKGKVVKTKVVLVPATVNQTEYWASAPLSEYELSPEHVHRQLILDILAREPFKGLLEVGCNRGQNLQRIQEVYPETQLAGIDVSSEAITVAQNNLPKPILKVGTATDLPFEDKSFDVVLVDAVWMYVEDINKAIEEALRVARKRLIVLDFEAKKEQLVGHTFTRDYERLLSPKVRTIGRIKITEETWPSSPKWIKYGQLYECHLV